MIWSPVDGQTGCSVLKGVLFAVERPEMVQRCWPGRRATTAEEKLTGGSGQYELRVSARSPQLS